MGFFATFWSWLNGQLAAYIGDNTSRLAGAMEPAVLTLATIYVMAWGYLHLTGKIATVLQMAVVLWILLRWDFIFQGVYLKILIAATGMFTGVSSLFYVWDGMRQLGSHPSSSPMEK